MSPSDVPLSGATVGRWALVSVQTTDHPTLYNWTMHPEINHRWTTRGAIVPYEAFERKIWEDTLANLMLVDLSRGQKLAWVSLMTADLHSGYCSAGVMIPPPLNRGLGVVATCLLLNYAFSAFPLRKVYFESPSFVVDSFSSALNRLLEVEGHLKSHLYYDGRYWDKYILTITRDSWNSYGRNYARRVLLR